MAVPMQMIITATCPYCRQAERMLGELQQQFPEWQAVEIELIDENKQPEKTEGLDYYYVPTIYVGGRKVMEGIPSKEKIEQALRMALGGDVQEGSVW